MHDKIHELLEKAQTLLVEDRRSHHKGERFNIFDVLGMGEVTHSRYLAEFLNPHGAHGLGERPLAAFVRRFKLGLDPATTRVKRECHLGPVTGDSGGRIDILLHDAGGQRVVIENKLYAAEQTNQLTRYQNDLSNARIIFLTLDGHDPDTIRDKSRILSLSYAKDIIAWQEECRQEASAAPLVRETITQYINLLKHRTHQNTPMHNEIVSTVLKDDGSLGAYFELVRAERAVLSEISTRLCDRCKTIAQGLKLKVEPFKSLSDKQGWFGFSDARMGGENICIRFSFSDSNFRGLKSGICYMSLEEKGRAAQETVQFCERISEEFRRKFEDAIPSPPWWLGMSEWKERDDWGEARDTGDTTLAEIVFDKGNFQLDLEDRVKTLLAVVQAARDYKN